MQPENSGLQFCLVYICLVSINLCKDFLKIQQKYQLLLIFEQIILSFYTQITIYIDDILCIVYIVYMYIIIIYA